MKSSALVGAKLNFFFIAGFLGLSFLGCNVTEAAHGSQVRRFEDEISIWAAELSLAELLSTIPNVGHQWSFSLPPVAVGTALPLRLSLPQDHILEERARTHSRRQLVQDPQVLDLLHRPDIIGLIVSWLKVPCLPPRYAPEAGFQEPKLGTSPQTTTLAETI